LLQRIREESETNYSKAFFILPHGDNDHTNFFFGVRRLGAALLSIMLDQGQGGARPPYSKGKLDAVN